MACDEVSVIWRVNDRDKRLTQIKSVRKTSTAT
jgi:hypothetical protein